MSLDDILGDDKFSYDHLKKILRDKAYNPKASDEELSKILDVDAIMERINGITIEPIPEEELEEYYEKVIIPKIRKARPLPKKKEIYEKNFSPSILDHEVDISSILKPQKAPVEDRRPTPREIFAGDRQITEICHSYIMDNRKTSIIKWLSEHLENYSAMVKFKSILDDNPVLDATANAITCVEKESTLLKYISLMEQNVDLAPKFEALFKVEPSDEEVALGIELYNTYESISMLNSYTVKIERLIRDGFMMRPLSLMGARKLLDEKVVSVLKKYAKIPGYAEDAIEAAFLNPETGSSKLEVYVQRLSKDNTLDLFEQKNRFGRVISKSLLHDTNHNDFLRKYSRHRNIAKIASIFIRDFEKKNHQKEIDVMEKYIDLGWVIEEIYVNPVGEDTYDVLLRESTYERVKEDPMYFDKICNARYAKLVSRLDEDFSFDIPVKEISNVYSTLEFVKGIHSKRGKNELEVIEDGFFDEMKRSVAEGHTYKAKLRLMRQYCAEVRDLMKDNAEELMVVSNA